MELELPKQWRDHNLNVFHTSLLEPYHSSAKGLHLLPVAITERRSGAGKPSKNFIHKSGVEHKVGYDVDGQRVYEGTFNTDEIMGSQYNTQEKKVLYLIMWEGYPEESEWIEEPLGYLPKHLVEEFHKRHPEAAMDDVLKKKKVRK